MSRLPLADPHRLTGDERAQYDRFPSNLTRALLLVDRRLARALPETANALRASTLDPQLREGVILRVAALQGSVYERLQHLEQAYGTGWTQEQTAAIEGGHHAALPGKYPALMAFVDACVASPCVDDATFDAVRATLSPQEIATTLLLIGHYMSVARLTGVLQIEPDAQADSWTAEH